jgi:hypothetical protein
MASNALRRTSIAVAMLTCLLATPRAVHAGDDAAARAAAANDPEYTAGYASPTRGAPLAGDCKDKPYAAREEFTKCQEQAAERAGGVARASAPTHLRTAAAPRDE